MSIQLSRCPHCDAQVALVPALEGTILEPRPAPRHRGGPGYLIIRRNGQQLWADSRAHPAAPLHYPVHVCTLLAPDAPAVEAPNEATPLTNAGTCVHCGGQGQWFPTARGKKVLLERGHFPYSEIPARKRWRVGEDGVARVEATGGGTCRISHFDVCPGHERLAPAQARLRQLWKVHAQRIEASHNRGGLGLFPAPE